MEIEFNPATLFKEESWISKAYYAVRYFFKQTLSKAHLGVVKEAFRGEPWDEGYLFDLEAAKIREMIKWQEDKRRFIGVEYVIRDMRLCLSLIEIFTDKRELFHFTGKLLSVPVEGEKDTYRIVESPDFKYHCDVNVNLRNISRFVPKEKERDFYERHPDEFYKLKARYLYHKIRFNNELTWWD